MGPGAPLQQAVFVPEAVNTQNVSSFLQIFIDFVINVLKQLFLQLFFSLVLFNFYLLFYILGAYNHCQSNIDKTRLKKCF